MRIRAVPLAAAILALGSGALPAAQPSPWTVPPPAYAFTAPAVCSTDPARAGKPTRPNHAAYRVCDDQMELFRQALAEAQAGGRLLLVSFGATWCPWCASMQRHLAGNALLAGRAGGVDLATAFHSVEIALSTLDKGQKADVPSGEAVLALVLRQASGVKVRTIPFLAVIDPADATRVFARNLDDVATRSGDFDIDRVRTVIADSHAVVRGGMPAAGEPGWLVRKWRRFWNG